MTKPVKLHRFVVFCYLCKKHIEVSAGDKNQATKTFLRLGHTDTKVPFLAPDQGRTSKRYESAVAKKAVA